MTALVEPAGQAPVPVGGMRDEIVMVAADLAADRRREAVRLIAIGAAGARPQRVVVVIRMLQRLGNNIVLERDETGATAHRATLPRTAGFIDRPTDRAMIHDGMRGIAEADAILRLMA